jgi:hypothetical protein
MVSIIYSYFIQPAASSVCFITFIRTSIFKIFTLLQILIRNIQNWILSLHRLKNFPKLCDETYGSDTFVEVVK